MSKLTYLWIMNNIVLVFLKNWFYALFKVFQDNKIVFQRCVMSVMWDFPLQNE